MLVRLYPRSPLRRRYPWCEPIAAGLFAALVVSAAASSRVARAAALLARFASGEHPPLVARALEAASSYDVREEASSIELGGEAARARRYVPIGVFDPPALVLVHGVHRLGVDEPRLQRFARALASAGVLVETPEIAALADYRIDAASVVTIGDAARSLARTTGKQSVGVLGLSFAGGLALLAASDARYRDTIAFVVAVGGHDDLARVARYFATGEAHGPDGASTPAAAHEYGALVLLYGHAREFFGDDDAERARVALRRWLANDRDGARDAATALSPVGMDTLGSLFEGPRAPLAPALSALIARHGPEMAAVSPAGHMSSMTADVFVLHGEGDVVIPPTEAAWLARDVPAARLRRVLVSPAVEHVELRGEPSLGDRSALIVFMADVLGAASRERAIARDRP